jgi:hypothetical protein
MASMDLEKEITVLQRDTSRAANRLEIVHEKRLKCRRGCSSCCVDDLKVFPIEADHIKVHHAALLSAGIPHSKGMCAFLDAEGGCRIYEERPYVCRTQGLPLRWLEARADLTVELRDICPLNDQDLELEPIESLSAEECWTIGPFEDRLAALQLSSSGTGERTALRDLFATKSP